MYKFFKDMWLDFWGEVKELFTNPSNYNLACRFLLNLFIGVPLFIILCVPYYLFIIVASAFRTEEGWD